MEIHIPNSAFIGNIESFTNYFNPENENELIVTTNQSWISIHPLVISMIVALAEDVRRRGGRIQTDGFNAKSRPYLLRMGLIDALDDNHGLKIDEHESAGRFIQARRIFTSEQLNQFIMDMVPLLHATPEQAFPIKYVMSELVRNVLEHSNSPIGAVVSAQYFAKTNRISIGVADRGDGVRSTIIKSHSATDDWEALRLAMRPGITGTTNRVGGTEYNAGAGLFFTKSIAKVSRDFFILYSGNSYFKLHKTNPNKPVQLFPDPVQDKSKFIKNAPFWNGTAVGIDISMDINQDFQDLLEMIRDAYQLDVIKERSIQYKKAKFI